MIQCLRRLAATREQRACPPPSDCHRRSSSVPNEGRRPGNVIAQAQRRRSAGMGWLHKQDAALEGRDKLVIGVLCRPFRARIRCPMRTQGCAPSSLPLGYYIAGPSVLHCLEELPVRLRPRCSHVMNPRYGKSSSGSSFPRARSRSARRRTLGWPSLRRYSLIVASARDWSSAEARSFTSILPSV